MALSHDTALLDVRALVQRAEAVRENEVRRLFSRCPDLTERERSLIAAMSTALIEQFLLEPISKLCDKRSVDQAQALHDARALSDLFDARSTP
jgi:glutamyl-tRNA reductase